MENDKTPPPDTYSDEDECDYDDTTDNNNQEVGMRIPRLPYRQNSSIARSLPISTPKPMTPFRGNDDDLDEMTEEAVDIAASIKAIAKSVHGDAVFGDLPRRQIQKFTSQIWADDTEEGGSRGSEDDTDAGNDASPKATEHSVFQSRNQGEKKWRV